MHTLLQQHRQVQEFFLRIQHSGALLVGQGQWARLAQQVFEALQESLVSKEHL
jgi:hypothetical protein